MNNQNGDKYTALAKAWGVESNDTAIQLLKEFDTRYDLLQQTNEALKHEVEQWRTLTIQILQVVQAQMSESKTLSQNTEKLSESSNTLSTSLLSCGNLIASQQPTLTKLKDETLAQTNKLDSIKESISNVPSKVDQNVQTIKTNLAKSLEGLKGNFPLTWMAIGLVFFLMLIQGSTLAHLLNRTNNNVNSALIRLRRVESRF